MKTWSRLPGLSGPLIWDADGTDAACGLGPSHQADPQSPQATCPGSVRLGIPKISPEGWVRATEAPEAAHLHGNRSTPPITAPVSRKEHPGLVWSPEGFPVRVRRAVLHTQMKKTGLIPLSHMGQMVQQ